MKYLTISSPSRTQMNNFISSPCYGGSFFLCWRISFPIILTFHMYIINMNRNNKIVIIYIMIRANIIGLKGVCYERFLGFLRLSINVTSRRKNTDKHHTPQNIHFRVVIPEAKFASLSVNNGVISTIRIIRKFSVKLNTRYIIAEKTDARKSR